MLGLVVSTSTTILVLSIAHLILQHCRLQYNASIIGTGAVITSASNTNFTYTSSGYISTTVPNKAPGGTTVTLSGIDMFWWRDCCD
jgi:hypothetical protein